MSANNQQGRFTNCKVCKTIKEHQGIMWVRDEVHGSIPPAEKKLRVVGAPFMTEAMYSSASRYTLLKQCPHCGTFYRCRLDYEYLAGGSEDEYTVSRLSDEIGIKEAEAVFESLKNRTPSLDKKLLSEKYKQTFKYPF